MESKLSGKVALVTGGSRGIGAAIVRKLSSLGATVVFSYVRDKRSGEALAEEIQGKGGGAMAVAADVSRVDDINELFSTTISQYGRLDILVNNAGIAIYRPIAEFTEKDYDNIFAVNVKGVFFSCREAAKTMADNGSIINIGSTVTRVMVPSYGAYAATKAAVEKITRVLGRELGGRGSRVNTLSPGPVDTELFRRGKTDEQISQMGKMAALGRIGTPSDVADMVAVLVSPESGWVSGQNILVNGGFIG